MKSERTGYTHNRSHTVVNGVKLKRCKETPRKQILGQEKEERSLGRAA